MEYSQDTAVAVTKDVGWKPVSYCALKNDYFDRIWPGLLSALAMQSTISIPTLNFKLLEDSVEENLQAMM